MDDQSSAVPENVDNSPLSIPNTGKVAESAYEQNLRRSIISIHNDSTLTPTQKAKQIQVKKYIIKAYINSYSPLGIDEPKQY